MWPLIVLSDESRWTLPVALANLSGEHVQDTELMMAGAVVTVLPVLGVFLVLQRYYVEGIMMGSVKGGVGRWGSGEVGKPPRRGRPYCCS
jgi:multiple sugar transport system permease protein